MDKKRFLITFGIIVLISVATAYVIWTVKQTERSPGTVPEEHKRPEVKDTASITVPDSNRYGKP